MRSTVQSARLNNFLQLYSQNPASVTKDYASEQINNFLNNNVDITTTHQSGVSLAYIANSFGLSDELKALQERGGNVPSESLHIAASINDAAAIKELLIPKGNALKYDPNQGGENANTPLHVAVMEGNKEAAYALCSNGSWFNIKNSAAQTPFDLALNAGRKDIANAMVMAFLDGFVDKDKAPNKADLAKVHAQIKYFADAKVGHDVATEPGDDNAVKQGDEVAAAKGNLTLLHVAANYGFDELCGQLIVNGSDVNSLTAKGLSPLHMAAFSGNASTAFLLIIHDAYKNQLNTDGNTPLHFAAAQGHNDVVDVLAASGANLNDPNVSGNTPKEYAIEAGKIETAKRLEQYISAKAQAAALDVDQAVQHSRTPNPASPSYDDPTSLIPSGANPGSAGKQGPSYKVPASDIVKKIGGVFAAAGGATKASSGSKEEIHAPHKPVAAAKITPKGRNVF
jgi:ankyrin repeat protein